MNLNRALIGITIALSIMGLLIAHTHILPTPGRPRPYTAPTISSFFPSSGAVGTVVTVLGTGFANATSVQLNGHSVGSFTIVSSTQLSFNVLWSATSGPITVINTDGQATTTSNFTVTLGIVASNPTPAPGSELAVNGTAFGSGEPIDIYFDTNDIKLAVANSNGDISVAVYIPLSATPGAHYFTAVGRRTFLAAQYPVTVRTNWGSFQNGALHQSVNPVENVLSASNVSGLQQDWAFAGTAAGTESPVISGGTAFIASSSGVMTAVNPTTGAQMWTSGTGGTIASAAAASSTSNLVYVGASDGKLYAFSGISGAPLWSYPTGAGIVGTPTLSGANIYFGSKDGKVYALNASTGSFVWSYATGGPVLSSPAVANGVVYIGSNDDSLYALNAATGALIWSYATGGPIHSSPSVANGTVYVGSEDNSIYAISAALGTKTWSVATGAPVDASPAVFNGIVYIGSGDAKFYALNAATGTSVWTLTTGGAITSAPAVANGVVYIGSEDHNLYALNAATGATLLTIHTDSAIDSSAAVANGMVYIVVGSPASLTAYDLNASLTPPTVKRPNPKQLHPNRNLKPTPSSAA